MKALPVIRARSFSTAEISILQLKAKSPDQILDRQGWISMCGSDIPFFNGSKRYQSFPLPWGSRVHECVGQVVSCKTTLALPHLFHLRHYCSQSLNIPASYINI